MMNFIPILSGHDIIFPKEIELGVYDVHSPRVPAEEEIINLLHKAARVIPPEQLWVNPDCGLKTRHWEETQAALTELVDAAKKLRTEFPKPAVVLTR